MFDYIVLDDKKPRAAFEKDGKWGYWKDGKVIYEPKYESLRLGFSLEHGYDLYEDEGLYGLLYEDGTVAIPAQFKEIHGFAGSTPLSYVILADGRNAYTDLKGEVRFYVRGEGTYFRDNLAPIFDVENVPRQQVNPNDYYTRTSTGYVKTTGAEMISSVVELKGDLKMDFVNQDGEIEKSGVPYSKYLK